MGAISSMHVHAMIDTSKKKITETGLHKLPPYLAAGWNSIPLSLMYGQYCTVQFSADLSNASAGQWIWSS